MSHLTCSKIAIQDIDILKKAVDGFDGLVWNEGAKVFTSYGDTGQTDSQFGTCEHSITVKGATYQIGVIKLDDGTGWGLAFDRADRRVSDIVGPSSEKIHAAYSEAYIRDFAEKSGFLLEESVDDEGNLVLSMTK
jgi:hypothetical protein